MKPQPERIYLFLDIIDMDLGDKTPRPLRQAMRENRCGVGTGALAGLLRFRTNITQLANLTTEQELPR